MRGDRLDGVEMVRRAVVGHRVVVHVPSLQRHVCRGESDAAAAAATTQTSSKKTTATTTTDSILHIRERERERKQSIKYV